MSNFINNFTEKPLRYIDNSNGKIFRICFYYILKVCSVLILFFGLFYIFKGLLGRTGYFSNFTVMVSTFETVRYLFCFFITFLLNILMFVAVSVILWKRAEHIKKDEINSILFLLTRLLRTIGECICVIPFFASLISFFAILLAAIPYAPVESLISLTGGYDFPLVNTFVVNTFSAIFIQNFQDYIRLLLSGTIGLFGGAALSFIIIFGIYLIAESFDIIFRFLSKTPKNLELINNNLSKENKEK